MPGGSERPGMPEAEGMTMHVTEYADGEEMYSYDYAMLGQKYCIDRIGGIHNDHYDYDICRIVFNPDLYELPVLWYGAPVSDGFIETTEQYRNTAFLWDSDYLSQTRDMEFEGETYHFEELCGTGIPDPQTETDRDAAAIAASVLEKESTLTANVFRLRTEGYTYFEIAEKLGISESSARVVFFRVKEKIRKELEKEGYST